MFLLVACVGLSCLELPAEEQASLHSQRGGIEVKSEGSGFEQPGFVFQPHVTLAVRTWTGNFNLSFPTYETVRCGTNIREILAHLPGNVVSGLGISWMEKKTSLPGTLSGGSVF